ncbi:hypothetical protein [Sphingomonas arenae]|uniref:hypothetical protein n=1 Tax=Sphingomonas arenae TaxID=2812555 RepID=UPI001968497A|nr:hypothetical protein [Sphingomonas arenae]
MPYPRAPYCVLVCVAVILAGFWQSYFTLWNSVPWQFHAHGVAASLWVLMVLAQSWTPHHAMLNLHRAFGKSSLLLFPFLIGGLMAIIDVTAKGFAAGNDPVRVRFGGEMLIGLALAIAAYLVLYYRALKFRRKVWTHAGYMLATPLILFESPLSRIFSAVMPGLTIQGPQDFDRLIPSILWAMAVELVVVAVLWWRLREKARPFLVAGLFIVAQMLTMGLMSRNPALEAILVALAAVPSASLVLAGMAIGAATSWAGWHAGKRAPVSGVAAQAA